MKSFYPYVPSVRVVVEDVSEHCGTLSGKELLTRCGGRLFEVWLFIEQCATYLCSAQAMAEIHFMGMVPAVTPDDERERDCLYDDLLTVAVEGPSVDYMGHERAMQKGFPLTDLGRKPNNEEVNDDDEQADWFERVKESFWGNAGAETAVDYYLKREV